MMARDKLSDATLIRLWRCGMTTEHLAACYELGTRALGVRWGRLVTEGLLPVGARAADVPLLTKNQIRDKERRHLARAPRDRLLDQLKNGAMA
jgi:hypothetical protein